MEDTRDLAKQLGKLAGELGTALSELERIETGAWKGKTAIAFSEYVGQDVTPLIRKSHESFDKASRALHRWAGDLQDFQDRADRLEKSAGDKLDAKAAAEGKAAGKGSDELAKASSAVDGVIQKVHELEADYRAAARQVSKELDKAGDIAPDEPGFWDKLGKESGETDQEVVAQGIKALLLRDPLREVTWLDLPCGPAVCGVSFQKLVVDGGYTKSGQDEELIMGQIQVHIPFATGPYTAVFTLDTASVEQWDEFAHAVAGIVGSVEFPPSTAPAGLPD